MKPRPVQTPWEELIFTSLGPSLCAVLPDWCCGVNLSIEELKHYHGRSERLFRSPFKGYGLNTLMEVADVSGTQSWRVDRFEAAVGWIDSLQKMPKKERDAAIACQVLYRASRGVPHSQPLFKPVSLRVGA